MARGVDDRRREILRLIADSSPRRLSELSEILGVSAVTLRKDVEDLAAQGRLRRMHGQVAAMTERDRSARGIGPTIGLVLPHAEYYFGTVIQGVRAAAAEAGARITVGVSAYDRTMEQRLVDNLVNRGVDGLLIAPTPDFQTGEFSDDVQSWLVSIPVPVVLVERPVLPGGRAAVLDSVGSAHATGAASAVRLLNEQGHTKVALVSITGPNSAFVRHGYLRGVKSCGITSMGELGAEIADQGTIEQQLSRLVDDGLTGILVHNDQLAMLLLGRLDDVGLRVPEDLSVICYDDISAELAQPALTAVAPQKEEVGRRAFQLLAARVSQRADGDRAPGAERVELIPRLRQRASTRAVG